MKSKKLRKLNNSRLRWEDKRNQRPYVNIGQFIKYPPVSFDYFLTNLRFF